MARYVNIYRERNVVIRKAYDCDYAKWISEHEFMVSIETDEGNLVVLPVMCDDYLKGYTADEYIKEAEDEDIDVIIRQDCPARDVLINNSISEWICNECAVSGSSILDGICHVVTMLERNGMWKHSYSKSIDIEKIKKELGEEDK